MTVWTGLLALIGVFGFAAASFFFALAETALFSLGTWRARQMAASSPAGRRVAGFFERSQELLPHLVLGNVSANAMLVLIAMQLVLRYDWPLLPTTAVFLLIVLVLCEVLPKTLAVRNPERWALRLAPAFAFFQTFARPLQQVAQFLSAQLFRWLVPRSWKPKPGLTDAEYEELLDLGVQKGLLSGTEKRIMIQILALDRRTAREVMVPRAQMAAISDDLPLETMCEEVRRIRKPRIPLYDETPDTIVGVLNARHFLLHPEADLSESIEFPSFVPESMNLLQLFRSLQRQQRGLAVVLDEYGGTAGVVSFNDILEEIFGSIPGNAEKPLIQRLAPGLWRLQGAARVDDFLEEYPGLGEIPGIDTMGGLLVHLLEVVPKPGQSAGFRGLRLTAEEVDERRVRVLTAEWMRKK